METPQPDGAGERRRRTETTPSGANPSVNPLRDAIHGFVLPEAIEKYQDGVQLPTHLVTPLDIRTDPMTYTMACRALLDKAGVLEGPRTPSVFKTVAASLIGSTALWTPAAGKKFRIMGFKCFIPSTATTAGGSTITLKDGAATVFTLAVLGTTTQIVNYQQTDMVNGYLSAAANNVLNIDLSAALTAGAVVVDVWGAEE